MRVMGCKIHTKSRVLMPVHNQYSTMQKESLSGDKDNHIDDPRKIDSYPAHQACSTEAIGEVSVMPCTIIIASGGRGLCLRGSYIV